MAIAGGYGNPFPGYTSPGAQSQNFPRQTSATNYRAYMPAGYQGSGYPSSVNPTTQPVAPQVVGNADGGAGLNGDPAAQAALNDMAFQRQWLQDQLGYNNAWNNTQRGYLGDDYQNQMDSLNWERGGLANRTTNAQQNLGFTDEQITNLQKMYGINDRELANRIAQSVLDQSVQSNVLNQQTGLNALTGLRQTQEATSRGIAGGGMFFPGVQAGIGQINEETSRNADILANRLRGVVEGGNLTREGLNIGAEGGRISLANQILGKQQGRLGDQQALYDLQRTGGKYDIQERAYRNQRDQALGGLSYTQNQNWMDAAYKMLQSDDAQLRELAQKWLSQGAPR